MKKPNILFIYTDQHRFDCLGVNGHPLLKTPNLDRLAAEGINFTNAFTPIPMCVPARCSMLSGQWPSQHGVTFNFDGETFKPLDPTLPTLGKTIKEAGYQTALIGRWHVDPSLNPTDFGFDHYQSDWEYRAWREKHNLPPYPKMLGCWKGSTDPIDAEQTEVTWSANRALDYIESASKNTEPFFLRWQLIEPHLPCFPVEPYASMYDPADLEPWAGFSDTFKDKPFIQQQMLRNWGVENWTWDEWAPIVARYLAIITQLDHEIGRVLDGLKELGLDENTVVVYSSDHGDMCGSHGMVDKHCVMYDDILRIPLIMKHPDLPAGIVRDDFVSNAIDLPATFCAIADADTPETFAGKNLLEPTDREDIFSCYYGNQFGGYSTRALRDQHWKYIWNATAEDELYHLDSDPGELTNLATDPQYEVELFRLRKRMLVWMEETNDRLNNPHVNWQLKSKTQSL